MNVNDLDDILTLIQQAQWQQQLVNLARRAGQKVLELYNQNNRSVQLKGDQSPLTVADYASHIILCQGLGALDPTMPIMSEEGREGPKKHPTLL